jgi:hypothetical protein
MPDYSLIESSRNRFDPRLVLGVTAVACARARAPRRVN